MIPIDDTNQHKDYHLKRQMLNEKTWYLKVQPFFGSLRAEASNSLRSEPSQLISLLP